MVMLTVQWRTGRERERRDALLAKEIVLSAQEMLVKRGLVANITVDLESTPPVVTVQMPPSEQKLSENVEQAFADASRIHLMQPT